MRGLDVLSSAKEVPNGREKRAVATFEPPVFVFVFDVGGVVVRLDEAARASALGADEASRAAMADANRAFRLGRSREDAFLSAAVEAYGMEAEAIAAAEEALLAGLYEDTVELIAELKGKGTVVAFSNTNELHWSSLVRRFEIDALFDRSILSHELGEEKPDAAAYRAVETGLGVAPGQFVLIDDTPGNVDTALRLGWGHAIHHRDAATTRLEVEKWLAARR